MYQKYFGFDERPFSIAPDPRYLFMTTQHKEALAHLLYGVGDQGGFVLLTGEVGTGKTTVCRCLLNQLPKNVDVAFIVNPRVSVRELLQSICDELAIGYDANDSVKVLIDHLTHYLLATHARGRNTILIIDEAQNLEDEVLEQLRLLTNLETNEKKLLQLILLGQPELRDKLEKEGLRQLAQRVTARFHLNSLSYDELENYIDHRLSIAGFRGDLFSRQAVKAIYERSRGVPRLVNVICDRSLLGAYARELDYIEYPIVDAAATEVLGDNLDGAVKIRAGRRKSFITGAAIAASICLVLLGGVLWYQKYQLTQTNKAAEIQQIDEKNQQQNQFIDEGKPSNDNPSFLSYWQRLQLLNISM